MVVDAEADAEVRALVLSPALPVKKDEEGGWWEGRRLTYSWTA